MKKIAYIIGHRNSDDENRLRNLKIVLKWLLNIKILLKNDIDFIIIIVEQDNYPKLNLSDTDITHIFLFNDGYYNRGWGFNVGYKYIDVDFYFFADNDIILYNNDIISVFKKCFKYEAINPYNKIFDSTKEYIENFDINNYDVKLFNERQFTCFTGGIVGLSHNALKVVNGWDERFRGRGYEDYAFTSKIKLFLYSLHTFNFNALHLWHNPEINTTKEYNFLINEEYKNYNIGNYVTQIEQSNNIGNPLKYSITGKNIENILCVKNLSYGRINYAKKIFNKKYDYYKKYNSNTLSYIYLDLCDLIKN